MLRLSNAFCIWCTYCGHFKTKKCNCRVRDLNFSLAITQLRRMLPRLSSPLFYLSQMVACFAFTADQPGILADCTFCDTSVGGTGNWHDGGSTCPAGDT